MSYKATGSERDESVTGANARQRAEVLAEGGAQTSSPLRASTLKNFGFLIPAWAATILVISASKVRDWSPERSVALNFIMEWQSFATQAVC